MLRAQSFIAALLLLVVHEGVLAQVPSLQSPVAVQRAVEEFVRAQTSGLGGRATFTTGAIDPKLSLPACAALEVFTPAGGRLWGNSSVGVRCGAPTPWTIYVAVTVRVHGAYLTAARPIVAGQGIGQADLALMQGDLTQLPPSVLTEPAQAIGKTSNLPLAPGQPVRADALRVLPAVVQGQTVRLVSEGPGFRVSAEGKAMANAALGQLAQVRTASGQLVSGVARGDGIVEVGF